MRPAGARRAAWTATVTAAIATLVGCTGGVPTVLVPGADAMIVVESDQGPLVFAVDASTAAGGATAALDTGQGPTIASTIVGRTPDGRLVLSWNTAGEPTRFTTAAADGSDLTDLGLAVDTGLAAIAGNRLATLRPVTDAGAQLELRYLDRPTADVETVELGIVPQALDADDGRGFLLAEWPGDGTLSLQVVSTDGFVGETRTIAVPGRVVAARWATTGIVIALAPPVDTSGWDQQDPPDDVRFVEVGTGSAFFAVGDGVVTYDDVDGGAPTVRVLRDDGTIVSVLLPDDEPVQGIRLARTGEVMVLQATRVIVWTPGDDGPAALELPGTTTSIW